MVTGAATDRGYLDEIWRDSNVVRLDGKLEWPALSALIAAARVYIGPDTAITHLAAATGTPTVALYGPTDPRLWGPWPVGGLEQPMGRRRHDPAPRQCLARAKSTCLVCRASSKAASAGSTATANVSTNSRPSQVMSAVDQALAMRQAA